MPVERITAKPLTVRFEPVLLEEIRQIAKFERRSLNDQVLYFLERAVEGFQVRAPHSYHLEADDISLEEAAAEQLGLEEDAESENSENGLELQQSA